jgi:hypothetical protein
MYIAIIHDARWYLCLLRDSSLVGRAFREESITGIGTP